MKARSCDPTGTLWLFQSFEVMAKGTIDASVINWIRKEINRIRAFIQSQPQREELTDVDTLLSVAESEAERHKAVEDSNPADQNVKKPPLGDSG